MKTKTELLRCPLCGGVAGKTTDPIGYGEAFCIIACTQCDCCVNVSDPDFDVVESKSTDVWNTRVYPPEVQKAIERDAPKKPDDLGTDAFGLTGDCPACGEYVVEGESVCSECGQRLDWSEE